MASTGLTLPAFVAGYRAATTVTAMPTTMAETRAKGERMRAVILNRKALPNR